MWALSFWTLLACNDKVNARIYSSARLAEDIEAYEEWDHAPGWPDVHAGCEDPHTPIVEIWLNEVAFGAMATEPKVLPDTAALVLQVWLDEQGTEGTLLAMRKVEGIDPDNGDWFWGAFDPEGAAVAAGAASDPDAGPSVADCVGCHRSGVDFVRFPGMVALDPSVACP